MFASKIDSGLLSLLREREWHCFIKHTTRKLMANRKAAFQACLAALPLIKRMGSHSSPICSVFPHELIDWHSEPGSEGSEVIASPGLHCC